MSNPQNQPHPIDVIGHYLNNCFPPAGVTTADAVRVVATWNEFVRPIIEAEKGKAKANEDQKA